MAKIPGSVQVTGFFAPTDSLDTYGVSDPRWGIGGFSTWAQLTDILNIPRPRRRVGMLVYNQNSDGNDALTAGYYKLINDPTNDPDVTEASDWESFGVGSGTGLEKVTKNGKSGWRYVGRPSANYGGIGDGATDLSVGANPPPPTPEKPPNQEQAPPYPTTLGALGNDSFAAGSKNLASGHVSFALGNHTTAAGHISFAWGIAARAIGLASLALGQFSHSAGAASTAIGVNTVANVKFNQAFGKCNTGVSGAIVEFGIGPVNYNGTPIERKNGLEIYSTGLVKAPEAVLADLQAEGSASKALVTKEYVQYNGTTANRPTSNLTAGQFYFDTTISKPIWYNGGNWVDATGAIT